MKVAYNIVNPLAELSPASGFTVFSVFESLCPFLYLSFIYSVVMLSFSFLIQ